MVPALLDEKQDVLGRWPGQMWWYRVRQLPRDKTIHTQAEARQTVLMEYVRAELKYGLSVEKGTDRVPEDGRYHLLADGEIVLSTTVEALALAELEEAKAARQAKGREMLKTRDGSLRRARLPGRRPRREAAPRPEKGWPRHWPTIASPWAARGRTKPPIDSRITSLSPVIETPLARLPRLSQRAYEGIVDGLADGPCYWWRESVAHLAVGSGLAPGESPVVGETLDTSDHAGSEFGHSRSREVRSGRLICHS